MKKTILASLCGLLVSACQPASTDKTSATHASSVSNASVASTAFNHPPSVDIASTTVSSQPTSLAKIDEPLTQLLATTLNNGFLLAVNKQPKLTSDQKICLNNFDDKQSLALAQNLLGKNLSQAELNEANEFYKLPVGQKVLNFNQHYFEKLKQGQPDSGNLDVSDDEKLQISAFIQTAVGQKIQQIASHDLQATFAPIETAQLAKCQVTAELFNSQLPTTTTASAPVVISSAPKP